jgi:hypothetical protein
LQGTTLAWNESYQKNQLVLDLFINLWFNSVIAANNEAATGNAGTDSQATQ